MIQIHPIFRWTENYRRAIIVYGVIFWTIVISLMVWNRDLPVVISGQENIPAGHPGEEIKFSFKVNRALDRDCSVVVRRSLVDSQGAGRPYGMPQEISHQGLIDRAALMGKDKLDLKITIPPTDPSGKAHILTDSEYTCFWNPSTWIRPIKVSYIWEYHVLEPDPVKAKVIIEKVIKE